MRTIATLTEADEQVTDKVSALEILTGQAEKAKLGLESYGVVGMFEEAARRAGCTAAEIEAANIRGSALHPDRKRRAWVHLASSGRCNYTVSVLRTKAYVRVMDPQSSPNAHTFFRIPAAEFDSGERQVRDGWVIEAWSYEADRCFFGHLVG